jgi:ParB family transcriptional regulator, chromosome partitioning protein
MTKRGEGWISRRGQADAATAVELVLERQPQEPVQQIADALIEDSPYQARQPMSDASLSALAQGMASAGFQGVLIVRPHGDVTRRRQGIFQLVYGHRRRAAWRLVCQERGQACLLPVVVREVSDGQMLTIGAQENLQRQDLGPVEEGQIVAWAERMFFDKNQAEIGAMLGKSEDWVRIRSRVAKLPEPLKDRLRTRPRAMSQFLELATLYKENPDAALVLADQVVVEQLSLERVRQVLRNDLRPPSAPPSASERGAAHVIQMRKPQDDTPPDTSGVGEADSILRENLNNRGGAAAIVTPRTKEMVATSSGSPSGDARSLDTLKQIQLIIAETRQHAETLRSLRDKRLAPADAQTFAALLAALTAEVDDLRSAAGQLSNVLH